MGAPVTVCWSVKGGSGTTVVASALALLSSRGAPTLLVDLAGDCAVALGVAEPQGPGVVDWLRSASARADALVRLAIPVTETLHLVHPGSAAPSPDDRWDDLAAALVHLGPAVVDAGTGRPPAELVAVATHALLVIRPCFLALRRAAQLSVAPSAIVLVNEPGRALRSREVEHALGVPVIVELDIDPAVARAVDAGLLASRLPRALVQQLRGAA
ncbi:MAG: ATPase involved in chromosome partitioning [Ilumatobacteraceae bacterium]|nr:ATPase involved in chromosome partitioning [Ilumatobacteraceae bacterium]